MFTSHTIPRHDSIQLRLCGTEVIANDLAQDGAVIIGAFQVTIADAEHRAIDIAALVGRTGDPGNRIARTAAEDSRGIAFVVTADRAAGDKHDAGFSVIGAAIGILNGCSPELRECYDHKI